MSEWLQRQALAPTLLHLRRRGRGKGRAAGGTARPRFAVTHDARGGSVAHDLPAAEHVALLAQEIAGLRRDLRRVGAVVLIAAILLALPYGWPALRWLLAG
jgi:hypothetical protein